MNRSGFTTVEVMIASALIITLVTGGAVGLNQITRLNQQASANTSLTEMRTRVYSALSDSGMCALQLGNFVAPAVIQPDVRNPINAILDQAFTPLIQNGKPAPGLSTPDGVVYWISLIFPTATVEASFAAGGSRLNPTVRYVVDLEVRGERKTLKDMGGAQSDIITHIPLYAEFEQATRKLVSCTYHAEHIDDGLLFAGTQSETQCTVSGGVVMPTRLGPICRFPVLVPPQTTWGYAGAIPKCKDIAGGTWTDAVDPVTSIHYNTTLPVHIDGRSCNGSVVPGDTEWHSMSPNIVEPKTIRVKKGTNTALALFLTGNAVLLTIATIINPAVGLAISAVIAIAAALYTWLTCKKTSFTFYAQVNGIGCI